MKKNYLWIAAALFAGILAIGCNKEQDPAEESNQEQKEVELVTETINAVANEGSTKVQIAESGATFTWSTNDKVAVRTDAGWFLSNPLSTITDEGASAKFTVTYGGTREAFAIFPSSLVFEDAEHVYSNSNTNNGSGSNDLTVNLPSSYALTDVSGDKAPCPMIATNTAGSGWTFKHLCGLLRLTINGIPAEADHLTIDFLGRQVNGAFTIANGKLVPGENTCVIETTSSENDVITITGLTEETSVTVNIPLPTGNYDDVVITPYKSSTQLDVMAIRHIKAPNYTGAANPPLSVYTASRAHRRKLIATLVSFTVNGSGKKVVFSPANLVATVTAVSDGTPTAVKWDFHATPRDVLYVSNVAGSGAYNTWSEGKRIDLFGWGTSGWSSGVASWTNYQPWSTSTTKTTTAPYELNVFGYGPDSNCYLAYNDKGAQTEWKTYAASQKGLWGEYDEGDWGYHNPIGSYPVHTWRTPRKAEWDYLVKERSVINTLSEGARYTMIKVNQDIGYGSSEWELFLILFPDNYQHPVGVIITGSPVYNSYSNFTGIVANYSDLEKMEAAGAVLLFAAGARNAKSVSPYQNGRYWTSDAEIDPKGPWENPQYDDNPKGEASRFVFGSGVGSTRTWGGSRHNGQSVRLVRDL